MKPYFARYLPVEGEIKEGDKYKIEGKVPTDEIFTCHHIEVDGEHVTIWSGKTYRGAEKSFCKKVKLFLCSRDIQVGDEIYFPKINEYHRFLEIKNGRIHCQTQGNTVGDEELEIQDYFKVIGEISPEATWVKEGDEFDEDEVCALYSMGNCHPMDRTWHYTIPISEFPEFFNMHGTELTEGRTKIGLKGPCGHFH